MNRYQQRAADVLRADPEWMAFLRHFDFSSGFSFGLLLVESREVSETCREGLRSHLARTNGKLESFLPESPEELLQLVAHLSNQRAQPDTAAFWVEAVIHESNPDFESWHRAWRRGFAALNQSRNRLQDGLECTLIFAGARWVKQATREAAPDLWSIRALVTEIQLRVPADGTGKAIGSQIEEERRGYSPDPEIAMEHAARLRGKPGGERALAQLLNRAGEGFFDRNALPEAIAAFREAYELAEKEPESTSLRVEAARGLGRAYWRQRRFHESEKMLTVALELVRALPEASRSQVASVLNSLALLYSDTQRVREAERAYDEALSLRRQLAEDDPQGLPDVAVTLNNLANLYVSAQRMREAEKAYDEALSIRRRLAEANPQALPDVAITLNNLANLYRSTQRMREAERAYDEALSTYRHLAGVDSHAYLPNVASTLNNLAIFYNGMQRKSEAEKAYDEALRLRRQLAEINPQAYLSDLALTLNNLAIFYKDARRIGEAEKAYDEALVIYRQLAESNPQAYLSNVALTLNNLAGLYSETQRVREAETAYDEALSIRRLLAKINPQTYLSDLAVTLNNLAILYSETGRVEKAIEKCNEARSILEPLWKLQPEFHGDVMARILWMQADLWGEEKKDPAEVCALAREAFDAAYDLSIKAGIEQSIARWCVGQTNSGLE